MLLSRWLRAVSSRLRGVRKTGSGRSRRGASRGHSLLTRAASWSTAPDGSVRSSEFTDVIEVLEDRSLLSAGDLDTTFSADGIATFSLGGTQNANATDTVVLSNGKILVAGYAAVPGNSTDFLLTRFNADGTLDTGFGTG